MNAGEERALGKLEQQYIHRGVQFLGTKGNKKGRMYYLFDDIEDFGVCLDWDEEDVLEADKLFHQGWTIQELADYFGRSVDETGLLVYERAIKKKMKVKKRKKRKIQVS